MARGLHCSNRGQKAIMDPRTRFWCTIAWLAKDLTTAPRAPASPFVNFSLNTLTSLSLLALSRRNLTTAT